MENLIARQINNYDISNDNLSDNFIRVVNIHAKYSYCDIIAEKVYYKAIDRDENYRKYFLVS